MLNKIINWLTKTYKEPTKEETLEDYYNNKYPKLDINYLGRKVPNYNKNIPIDVKNFFTLNDSNIKQITNSIILNTNLNDDEKAYICFKWVKDNIKYISDDTKGSKEYWQFPFETIHYMSGDCEDGAILMSNMMIISGVPYWKIRLTAGDTPLGGHAYVVYYCEEQDDWKTLDWCYFPNDFKINERPSYKENQLYGNVWFSWNSKYSFSEGLNNKSKSILK